MGEAGEHIYGGGEQYTYLDLKVDDTIMRHLVILKIHPLKGRNYPIWVREQGVGRNKSSEVTVLQSELPQVFLFQKMTINLQVTQIMDML